MGSITTLRPSGTASGTGWTAQPGGTLHGVTSDDSDSTYALWSGTGSALALLTPVDAPPAGERRHQVRMRARGEDGDAWWAVRLTSGALVAGASAQFPSSPTSVLGSWGAGVPHDGSIVLSAYVAGQSTGVKITELYIDVDSREAPTFTAQTLDGSGTVTTTISDTNTPTIRAFNVDADDLTVRQYRYRVASVATTKTVWDTGIVSGSPIGQMTTPLDNGDYVAYYQVWSTLGANTAYSSIVQEVPFTVAVNLLPQPVAPSVNPVVDTPFYSVEVCAPYVTNLDDGVGYIEIQRADCVDDLGEPATVTTIALLGPLTTDECASWTDYSLPRTGLGASCDHDGEMCCSYYRARTVGLIDDSILVSRWSDVLDLGVPAGMIVLWPSTAASIPAGWDRVTALNGRYTRGIPNIATQPRTTGGAATHTHAVSSGHTHDESHSHTASGATSAAVGSISSSTGAAGTTAIAASHTHTVPATSATATVVSGSTSPGTGSVANDPARLEVVFIESDGSPLGVPNNALSLMPDISPSGWTDYANGANRFFKGATGDGGTTAASTLDNHVHTIAAHTHTGTSHTHTNQTTGDVTSNLTLNAGPNAVLWITPIHNHTITFGAASTAALASGGSGNSNATSRGSSQDPAYTNVRIKQNTSGGDSLPVGMIGIWRGSLGSIPSNWRLCDGFNGTPDLFSRFPRGATSSIGGIGGSDVDHFHTTPTHTHTTSGHQHTMAIGAYNGSSTNVTATSAVTVANNVHTHTHGDTAATTPTVGSSSTGNLANEVSTPPYEEVAFLQMTELPSPEAPETFCLVWDSDEHLIRTTGPDGPLWAPVYGRFTWTVDRPFNASTGLAGSRFVSSAPPGGRNLKMTAAVESEAALAELLAVLNRPLVLVSPSDSTETWAAPITTSVQIVMIGRIRQVTAEFIATGPQPGPQLADIGS